MEVYDYFTVKGIEEIFIKRCTLDGGEVVGRVCYTPYSQGNILLNRVTYGKISYEKFLPKYNKKKFCNFPYELSYRFSEEEIDSTFPAKRRLNDCICKFYSVGNIVKVLERYGIRKNNLGIIGSHVFSADGKDIDLVLYREDDIEKLRLFTRDYALSNKELSLENCRLGGREYLFKILGVPKKSQKLIDERQWFRKKVFLYDHFQSFFFSNPEEVIWDIHFINEKIKACTTVTGISEQYYLPPIYSIDYDGIAGIIAFSPYYRTIAEVGDMIAAKGDIVEIGGAVKFRF